MKNRHSGNLLPDLHQSVFVAVIRLAIAIITLWLPSVLQAGDNDLRQLLNQVESGTLIIAPQVAGARYQMQGPLSTDVQIDVSGLLARAHVKQTFRNHSEHWIEAVYAFPLADESRVDRMEMQIGERIVKGVIRGKKQAIEEYTQAMNEGKRASLLESQRANLFTNRIANIPPNESIQISFSYQWQVDYDDGVFGLRVPLTITPRYLPGARLLAAQHAVLSHEGKSTNDLSPGWLPAEAMHHTAPVDTQPMAHEMSPPMSRSATPTSIFVTIDTAIPLESVSSPSHDIHTDQTDSQWRVSLANGMVPTDRDFTLAWSPLLGHSPLAAVFTRTLHHDRHKPEHFASVMVMPPQELYQSAQIQREVIFVIDTSGSMQGNSIRQARSALQFAIERLTPNDTFNVIEFNSVTRSLFKQARTASDNDKATALGWVRSLSADGGTEIATALDASLGRQPARSATPGRLRQVVFITDGSVGNEAELFLQIKNTIGHSRLFTVGIGSAPNTWFMRRAAETGRGTYTYIAKQDQVQEQMSLLLQKLEKPVLTDISLQWNGIESPEVYPSIIADLYAGEPILFDARWQGDAAAGTLSIHGMHNGSKWSSQLQIDNGRTVAEVPHSASLEKQWAHRKIESMENSLLFSEEQHSIEKQITDLALRYAMVTRYTSLVAIDQQVARDPASSKPVRTAVPSTMPHGNTMLLPQGSLGIASRLLLAALFFVCALVFRLATQRRDQIA